MLLFIFTLGGLLLMMGHQTREQALFYWQLDGRSPSGARIGDQIIRRVLPDSAS